MEDLLQLLFWICFTPFGLSRAHKCWDCPHKHVFAENCRSHSDFVCSGHNQRAKNAANIYIFICNTYDNIENISFYIQMICLRIYILKTAVKTRTLTREVGLICSGILRQASSRELHRASQPANPQQSASDRERLGPCMCSETLSRQNAHANFQNTIIMHTIHEMQPASEQSRNVLLLFGPMPPPQSIYNKSQNMPTNHTNINPVMSANMIRYGTSLLIGRGYIYRQ